MMKEGLNTKRQVFKAFNINCGMQGELLWGSGKVARDEREIILNQRRTL